jgi:hypothetical protein
MLGVAALDQIDANRLQDAERELARGEAKARAGK